MFSKNSSACSRQLVLGHVWLCVTGTPSGAASPQTLRMGRAWIVYIHTNPLYVLDALVKTMHVVSTTAPYRTMYLAGYVFMFAA